jgi:hypothetical protein
MSATIAIIATTNPTIAKPIRKRTTDRLNRSTSRIVPSSGVQLSHTTLVTGCWTPWSASKTRRSPPCAGQKKRPHRVHARSAGCWQKAQCMRMSPVPASGQVPRRNKATSLPAFYRQTPPERAVYRHLPLLNEGACNGGRLAVNFHQASVSRAKRSHPGLTYGTEGCWFESSLVYSPPPAARRAAIFVTLPSRLPRSRNLLPGGTCPDKTRPAAPSHERGAAGPRKARDLVVRPAGVGGLESRLQPAEAGTPTPLNDWGRPRAEAGGTQGGQQGRRGCHLVMISTGPAE